MITKDNIKQVLLSEKFGFFARHGVFSKHFGSVDEGFDLEYNFESGEFHYPEGVTTQDEHQNESFVVFLCVAQLFEHGYLPHQLKLEGNITVQIPSMEIQSIAIKQIKQMKNEINKAQHFVDACPSCKQAILDKYLK